MAYGVLRRDRTRTLEHLRLAFGGEKSEKELRGMARNVFMNLGRNAAEVLSFPKLDERRLDHLVSEEGVDGIRTCVRQGRGAVLVTAHLGNWEMVAAYGSLKQFPLYVLARRLYFEGYERMAERLRHGVHVRAIDRDASFTQMVRLLREGNLIGLLPDQDVDSLDGVFVKFFGQPAYTPIGPVALAMTAGVPIFPIYIVRMGHDRHRIFCQTPMEMVRTGDRLKDLAENTRRWSEVTESFIRRFPDQWVWMHRRWKTQPSQKPSVPNLSLQAAHA